MKLEFQPGDLAACYGNDLVGRTISWGTATPFAPPRLRLGPSHVAILCEWNGGPLWVESTTLCRHRCAILGWKRNGAQAHLPEERIGDYVESGGRVDLYRLSPIDRLSRLDSELLSRILVRHFVGKLVSYDTGGAILSGTRILKYARFLPGADLEQLFCSELVAGVLMRLGRLNRQNPTRFNPASLLRRLVRDGTYQFERTYARPDSKEAA